LTAFPARAQQAERRSDDCKRDFDDISKLVKAELTRVDIEKVNDFKSAIADLADDLADRQKQVRGPTSLARDTLLFRN
jgi:sorting nexin-1/2